MTVLDLDATDLDWHDHQIAGAEKPARMVLLNADAERGTRTVMVQFPDGWQRGAVGHQPAGEEMVMLSGALSISGATAGVGDFLVIEPRATRSATSAADGTRALVWFSGAGGGWTDGPSDDAGSLGVTPLAAGEQRGPGAALVGTVTVHDDLPEQTFETDVDVLWTADRRWQHAPAGTTVPARAGRAVVRHWG